MSFIQVLWFVVTVWYKVDKMMVDQYSISPK